MGDHRTAVSWAIGAELLGRPLPREYYEAVADSPDQAQEIYARQSEAALAMLDQFAKSEET